MAASGPPNPYDPLRRVAPPVGPPVPNMGGTSTTQPRTTPVQPPAPGARPGPAPGTPPPAPAPAPATTPGGAERYLASFGPEERKRITGSFVASKGDDLQKWFQNAVAAGAVNPDGTRKVPGAAEVPRRGGGGGAGASAAPAAAPGSSLESTISAYIAQQMAGGAGIPQTVLDQMKVGALRAAEGRRKAAVDVGNEDLIGRGLYRSGIGARMAEDAARGASSDYTQAVADIMQKKAEADATARREGAQMGLNLLESNRQNALEQAKLAAASRGRGGPKTFTWIDPETGDQFEMPADAF